MSLGRLSGRTRATAAALALFAFLVASGSPERAMAEEYPTNVVKAITFGGSGVEITRASDTDRAGNTYIVGDTRSDDYPQVGGLGIPFHPDPHGFSGQGFATKFDAAGEVVYSTYLPIRQTAEISAAVGPDGSLYVVRSRGYPDPDNKDDLTVLKLDPSGRTIEYETDIAPMGSPSIAVDEQGRAIVVGSISGPGFPVSPDARLTEPNPARPDRPYGIVRLAPSGAVQHASYIEVYPSDVEVADDGSVYVGGSAEPEAFRNPAAPAPLDAKRVNSAVARLSPSLRKLKHGVVADIPGGLDYLMAIAVADDGRVYGIGHSVSGDIDEIEPLDPHAGASESAQYVEFSPDGSKVRQLALMGGDGYTIGADIQIAPDGSVVAAGTTYAPDFPAHGAAAGGEASAAFAFRVEDRQLTHSTAYVNEFVSSGEGVHPAADGLVQVVGWGTPAPFIGAPYGPGEAFLTTLRLDPYVDNPQIRLRSRQRIGSRRALIKLRAGASEDVDLRAGARLKVRAEGRRRSVRLRSPKRRAEGYTKARLVLKPATKRFARLLRAAVRNGKPLRTQVRIRFRDRGDAVARRKAKVSLIPRR